MNNEFNNTDSGAKPKSNNAVIKWGIIGAALSIAVGLSLYLAFDGHFEKTSGLVHWVPVIIIAFIATFMAAKETRDKHLGGYISYGKAFGTGFMTTLVITVIVLVYSYFLFNYIMDFDQMVGGMMDESVKQMKAQGKSDEQIKQALGYMQNWMTPTSFLIWGFIMNLIIYTLVTLVSAAVAMKKAPNA